MHLGLVTSSYPRFSGDWAGGFVREQALDLVRRGHRVTVVCPHSPSARPRSNSGCVHSPAPLVDEGISVVRAPVPDGVFYGPGAPERFRQSPAVFACKAVPALASLIFVARRALADCHALLGHWLFPGGAVAGIVASGRPWAVVTHSTAARWALRSPLLLRGIFRELPNNTRGISATDPALAGNLSAALQQPVFWLPPHDRGARLASLLPTTLTRGIEEPLTIGYLGRPAPVKGRDLLVHAMSASPHRWVLAGPGWQQLPTGQHCIVKGPLSSDLAVARFLSQIDVLLIPSETRAGDPPEAARNRREEGLPTVLLEAWACGVPVLAAPSGALRWLVPRHLRLEPRSVDALQSKLAELAAWSPDRWHQEREQARRGHRHLTRRRSAAMDQLLSALE